MQGYDPAAFTLMAQRSSFFVFAIASRQALILSRLASTSLVSAVTFANAKADGSGKGSEFPRRSGRLRNDV